MRKIVACDRIVAATGFRPDHSIAAELRLDLDPVLGSTRALAPLIDPNEHSCGTVPPHGVDELAHPEPGFYAVGMKSYGRGPDVPAGDRLRAGPFCGRRAGRRLGRGQGRAAGAAGDRGVQHNPPGDEAASGGCGTSCGTAEPAAQAGEQAGGCCGTPEPVSVGLATGLSGGLLSTPLTVVGTSGGSGCCS